MFLSNGPGDPEPCDYAIAAIRELLVIGVPLFESVSAINCWDWPAAHEPRNEFGHHGGNHPVIDLQTGQVMISSQNHGFAVDETTLPANVRPTHRSLFDGSLQGIACVDQPAFSFQGHPEASPGPHDVAPLFDRFIGLMAAYDPTDLPSGHLPSTRICGFFISVLSFPCLHSVSSVDK